MMSKISSILILVGLLLSTSILAADLSPGFDVQDLDGSTAHYSGTADTSPTTIPAVADKIISEIFFKCNYQTPNTKQCLISLDGGSSWLSMAVGEYLGWSIKGRIKQFKVKGSTSGVTYQGLINYEAY